jgi:hypothetical protein
MYKVTYIDNTKDSMVRTEVFDTLFKAIGFTNQQPRNNQILELKFYDDEPVKKENRT